MPQTRTDRFLSLSTFFLVFLSAGFVPVTHATVGCNAVGWDHQHWDVQGCTLYYPAIQWLYDQGVAEGVPDKTIPGTRLFEPDRPVNRAEFTKLVLLASGVRDPLPSCVSAPFPDVPKDAWFAPYICAAKERGIISGFPDGTFKPAINVNFANAAKILVKTLVVPTDPNDAQFGEETVWYRPYTAALLRKGATAESIAAFDQSLTRGEMAEMLFRLKTGQTSFTTPRDEDSSDLGMGYNTLEDAFGFYLSTEPDPPFIFTKSQEVASWIFGHPLTLHGYAFSHVLQSEHCGESGLWEHCTPLFTDWSVGFYRVAEPADRLASALRENGFEQPEQRSFGGKSAVCATTGVEGEYGEYCVIDVGMGNSLVVLWRYLDDAALEVPGMTPLATSQAKYARIRQSMQF